MNETTILLSPDPGNPNVKPDFLATVEPLLPREPPFNLPFELVLDGYTREKWSLGKIDPTASDPTSKHIQWQSCYLHSTDGRNRLPGFIKFLQGRKKAAIAKFESANADTSTSGKSILVVPFDPPPIPPEQLPNGIDANQVMYVKYLRDDSILRRKGTDAAQKQQQQMKMQQQQQQKMEQQKLMQEKQKQQQLMQQKKAQQQQAQRKAAPPPPVSLSGKKGGGLLGSLLGAQRRTENHLAVVRSKKPSNDQSNFDPNAGVAGCINTFRTRISGELEKFKSDPTTFTTKIEIQLPALQRTVPAEERDKITMDIFKFTVYEQVEEVGLDKWIAAKEPSDFMDECTISIYKEGHCPPEVLEDMNKGELPDEIIGQTRHLVAEQSKAIHKKGTKEAERKMKESIVGEDNVTVLNANKRDRRTLEQIQKDLQGESADTKRSRFD